MQIILNSWIQFTHFLFSMIRNSSIWKARSILTQIQNQFIIQTNRNLAFSTPKERLKRSTANFYSSLGNKSYKKLRKHNSGRWSLDPIEHVNEVKAGSRRFSSKVIGLDRDRPECSFPMTRLPKPKYDWDQNLTEDNKLLLNASDYQQQGRITVGNLLKGISKISYNIT